MGYDDAFNDETNLVLCETYHTPKSAWFDTSAILVDGFSYQQNWKKKDYSFLKPEVRDLSVITVIMVQCQSQVVSVQGW